MKNKESKRFASEIDLSISRLELLSDEQLHGLMNCKFGYTESTKLRARRVYENRQFNRAVY